MRFVGLPLILTFAACGAQLPQSPSGQPMSTPRFKSGGGWGSDPGYGDKKPQYISEKDALVIGAAALAGLLIAGGLVWALSGEDSPSAAKPKGDARPAHDDMDLDEIFDRQAPALGFTQVEAEKTIVVPGG